MAKESILIVDDNEMNVKLLRWLLEKNGYDVHTAGDAKTARVSVRAVRPDLVLMDIQLPDVDGLQLRREFKADPELRDIPAPAFDPLRLRPSPAPRTDIRRRHSARRR